MIRKIYFYLSSRPNCMRTENDEIMNVNDDR